MRESSVWETIAAAAATLHGAPDSTIKPNEPSLDDVRRDALVGFDEAALDAGTRLEVGEVLGEGGRGIVRSAMQTVLGREVAVKSLRPALRGPGATLELLREAWIAGRLEHPNIIPVYDIARDVERNPLIVLKRIEGVSWAHLLADPERARSVLGPDLLAAHLDVLITVCNAIDFAHDRRIIHLDLKPENVMIGGHGEVHVVDWGVAAALEDDGSGRIPIAAKRHGIVGTPAYMAPEMARGDGALLDERTDVYLLGSMLHEVLAGSAPHRGETIMKVLHAVVHEDPALPADAPSELAAICRRAMARDPGERFASAKQLRLALQGFSSHRGSMVLADQATLSLAALELALAAPSATVTGQTSERAARQERFVEVRFGFEQALLAWPENLQARVGLERAFVGMIEFELAHGDPHVAASLSAQIDGLPTDLRERVARAADLREANLGELVRLRRDQDLRIGQRTRVFVFSLVGLCWMIFPLIEQYYFHTRSRTETMQIYAGVSLGSLIGFAGLCGWARDSLSRTRVNRLLVATVAIALALQFTTLIGAWVAGLGPLEAMTMMLMVSAGIVSIAAINVEPRGLWIAAGFLVGFGVSAWSQEWVFWAWAGANLWFVGVVAIIWWPARVRGAIPEPVHRV